MDQYQVNHLLSRNDTIKEVGTTSNRANSEFSPPKYKIKVPPLTTKNKEESQFKFNKHIISDLQNKESTTLLKKKSIMSTSTHKTTHT